MPLAVANGIQIAYEVFGSDRDPAVVLIMGLGTQLVYWDQDFCEALAAREFRVVRLDNRDVGQSTRFHGATASPAYTLDDMAGDVVGLLDALDIAAAHLVGVSLGGMIAQVVAITYPERVLSLCSMSSTTGAADVGRPLPGIFRARLSGTPATREEAMDRAEAMLKLYGGSGFPGDPDPARQRWLAAQAWDRSSDQSGLERHWAAIKASGDRTEALHSVRAPTVVLHGDEDPAIGISGGKATARAIPGAQLVAIPGMGHELPRGAWKVMIDAIATNAHRIA